MGWSGKIDLLFLLRWRLAWRGCRIVECLHTFAQDFPGNVAFEQAQRALIFRRHKTDGIPHGLRAARPAYAVNVILRVHWEVIIDDV